MHSVSLAWIQKAVAKSRQSLANLLKFSRLRKTTLVTLTIYLFLLLIEQLLVHSRVNFGDYTRPRIILVKYYRWGNILNDEF